MCLMGWIMSRKGVLDKNTQKQLNRLNVSLFTPCLLFSKVAFSLSPEKLKELWIIPLFFVGVTSVSAVVAWTLGTLFRLRKSQRNFCMAAAMFNNSNSLPVALMQSLVVTVPGLKWDADDTGDAMLGRALGYLVLYSTMGMVLRWSYGVHLLTQADEEAVNSNFVASVSQDVSPPSGPVDFDIENVPSSPLHQTLSIAPIVDQLPAGLSNAASRHARAPLSPGARHPPLLLPHLPHSTRFFHSFPNTPVRSLSPSPASSVLPGTRLTDESEPEEGEDDEWGSHRPSVPTAPTPSARQRNVRRVIHSIKVTLKKINNFMTVPLWAALSSIVVALIPTLQHVMLAHVSPVKGFLESAGGCSIPITLVVLGAYFNQDTPTPAKVTVQHEELRNEDATGDEPDERTALISNGTLCEYDHPYGECGGCSGWRLDEGKPETRPSPGETRTVFVACVARMVVTPMIVLPCVGALTKFDVHRIFDDPVFVVSNVLLISAPPALTLAQITQAASGDAFERLISRTIFWAYCILTPPLALLYVVVGLYFSRL
ncbi:hypothetical protein BS47DRAFT_1379338 [Hydnum rufescens UP504]|uniref:PIN-like protein n=1 Tax=Hydnum rufescens UP504 TaxID=1448309 RepID=A0A9P6B9C5_9AGAM|nr:hypothetical protein BS47DRAFT_1379338 [Hydnum rufescens UP504]